MNLREETYLGDGLYAFFDGMNIVLRAPGPEGDDVVFLELPSVFNELIRFKEQIDKLRKENFAASHTVPS